MLRSQKARTVVLIGALFTACATTPQTGIISATWTPPGKPPEPVVISWESEDTITGPMYVTLGKGGERFTGNYLRITSGTKLRSAEPILGPWNAIRESGGWAQETNPYWWSPPDGWPIGGWDGGFFPEFVRQYSGKVVATLFGNRGDKMRCSFDLFKPQEGLIGGGTGECQASNGAKLTARF